MRSHWAISRAEIFFFFYFFFAFAGDYTGRPIAEVNDAVLRRSPMVPYVEQKSPPQPLKVQAVLQDMLC